MKKAILCYLILLCACGATSRDDQSWYDINCGGLRCGDSAGPGPLSQPSVDGSPWPVAARVTIGALVAASVTYGAYTIGKMWMAGEAAAAAVAVMEGSGWAASTQLAQRDADWAEYFRQAGAQQTCWTKVSGRSSALRFVIEDGQARPPQRGDFDRIAGHRAVFCADLPGPILGYGDEKIAVAVGNQVELIQYDGNPALLQRQADILRQLSQEGVPALQMRAEAGRWFAARYTHLLRPEDGQQWMEALVRARGNHHTVDAARRIIRYVERHKIGDFQVLFHEGTGDLVVADPREILPNQPDYNAAGWLRRLISWVERGA